MTESFLVKGVAFKRTFSYAGFEQQPKKFAEPKILSLNLELELKSEKENAEIRDRPEAEPLETRAATVSFERVDFGYESERQILFGVDFTIPAGQTVARGDLVNFHPLAALLG